MIEWLVKLGPRFHRAFIEGSRWKLYLKGLGATVEMTVLALCMGIILGVLVAVVRAAHDQQRPGQHNIILGILNAVCKIYTTILRGTPMMVQLLIWAFVAFKNILPSLGNEFITLFKDTSLVQAIGGAELAYYASTIGGTTFDYMPPYIGIAVMYLVIVVVLTALQGKLERRLRQSDRR